MKHEKQTIDYEIKVGEDVYPFADIKLEQNAIGKWALPYSTVHLMMKSVASEIIANTDTQLSFAELEHLADTAELSMSKIADMLQISRSTITKWKSSGSMVPYAESFCLKTKLAQLIFNDPRGNNPSGSKQFWQKSNKLPQFHAKEVG